MRRVPRCVIAGMIGLALTCVFWRGRATPYDNYVLLAQALLEGHAWIHFPGSFIDALQYNGLYYVIEAPFPALLLIPFVHLFQNVQTPIAVVLTGVATGAAWELGERLGLRAAANAWICGFLLLGTDLLWCGMLGDVWFIAHVCAVCFTLLALVELVGKRRAWLVMLWAACAFESRFTLVLVVPIYLFVILSPSTALGALRVNSVPNAVSGRIALYQSLAVLVPVAVLWVLYNEARWGTWNDIGYVTWYHQDPAGSPIGSPFQLRYLGYELRSFFLELPVWGGQPPWLFPSPDGTALTWTSPALVLAFFARRPSRLVEMLWIATVVVAIPNLLYYVNGFDQFGMRHALDFEPFLLALMMLAVREKLTRWGIALIAYSMLAGLWGCWFWSFVLRPT